MVTPMTTIRWDIMEDTAVRTGPGPSDIEAEVDWLDSFETKEEADAALATTYAGLNARVVEDTRVMLPDGGDVSLENAPF